MGLNLGQTLSSMGIIANRQREAEDAMLRQRQLELQTQELNQLERIRASMGKDAMNIAGGAAPMQFVQTPGSPFGAPQPAAPGGIPAANGSGAVTYPVPNPPKVEVRPLPPTGAGAGRGTVNPPVVGQMTPQQIQREQDRIALLRAPTALADVVQAPAAAGLNVLGSVASGAQNLTGRVVNAITGEQTLPTDVEYRKFSMTPFYDEYVRKPEAQLNKQAGLEVPGAPKAPAKPAADQAALKTAQQYDKTKTQYDTLIAQTAQANGIDPVVFKRLIGTESSFNPNAVSPRGEQFGLGIAQIAAVHGLSREDMLNPQKAIPFAAQLFSKYLAESGGNYQQAIMKYKGASSAQGQQAMTGPAATILAGIDTTAKKAPDVIGAVQTGTAKDVATAVVEAVKPATSGTMYGSATIDPSVRNPIIQQTLQVRQALQNQVKTYAQYGRGDLAMEAAAKIQAIDLGLYKSQADIGLYEGATTGNFSRAMAVLSTFTGAPHQVMQRPDGNFDLYVNGKVSKAGLKGDQIEMLVRTQVDKEYAAKLAAVQVERGNKEFESGLKIREKASEITLTAAKEIQKAVVEGNVKLAEERLKQSGFKLVGSSGGEGGIAYYSNGLGDVFVIDPSQKKISINGTEIPVGAQAQRVSGVDRSIWSSVNAPQQPAK